MTMRKIALIGNPNIGKSSLFNQLTGLRQKVGNYPGITVDKKTGTFQSNGIVYKLYDLPGTYSLYPQSQDEEIAYELIVNTKHKDRPDKVMVVADATHLKRSLQLLEQVLELGLPTLLVVNLIDEAGMKGISIDVEKLREHYQIPIVLTNARLGTGITELKEAIAGSKIAKGSFQIPQDFIQPVRKIKESLDTKNEYVAWHLLAMPENGFLSSGQKEILGETKKEFSLVSKRLQVKEFLQRDEHIKILLDKCVRHDKTSDKS